MAKQKSATETEAEEAAAALLRFWIAGRGSWGRIAPDEADKTDKRRKARPTGEPDYKYGNKLDLLHTEAERLDMNYDTLAKAWKVAREYTREQIEALGEMVVEHCARFGPTHLTRLLAVADRKRRDALAKAAIRGRWGVTRLERKIQAEKRGRRPLVGKKPVIPDTEPELLAALGALADKWVRWVAAAEGQIPDDLTDVLNRATAAVAKVKTAVATKLSESE
jgi:hypothetical protein